MNRSLDLSAHLTLTLDQYDMTVQAERDQVVVTVPNWRAAMALLADYRSQSQESWMIALPQQLRATALTISIELAGLTLARLGAQAHPSWLAQRLNLGPVELRPIALAWGWLQNFWRH